jgi:hypothetical protein
MPEAAVQRGPAQIIADLNVFSNPEWQRACDTLGAWKAETDKALTERVCCALCGASDFKHVNIKCGDGTSENIGNSNFKEVAPPSPTAIPPYLLQSEVCEGQCVTPGGQWIACQICRGKKAGQRAKLQPAVSPPLLRDLLTLDPVHAQLLSAVDACLPFTTKYGGYAQSAPAPMSLFDAPLLLFDVRTSGYVIEAPADLIEFFEKHLKGRNPALLSYFPVLEFPHPTYGVPYLNLSEINAQHILNAAGRRPTSEPTAKRMRLSTLIEMSARTPRSSNAPLRRAPRPWPARCASAARPGRRPRRAAARGVHGTRACSPLRQPRAARACVPLRQRRAGRACSPLRQAQAGCRRAGATGARP